ncbi:16S rRNA (cytosine(967)-C(5))-methyltransferase RsmB [Bacillus aquiflavi]|uniref:16S rRNA (cytosine(967)-C(5))-methyltransferase n=1 Tax=Bacillus aquiflavi TaxID=2672567 RepID=A0A6B3VZP2_9BACI|nr:16S rRNA (cytosine(967)-C(5))-methyltransferase RsmB [Bacillus aquiflavi]MBA4538094.1 16S rRNA (cytosine(967)-C(5))-methyltransferase RsmB [Bacillus aquiflavi]NEY82392.1 16S rRNA (cytosine(967)-C(5))-methyltransferase RsmB [Bacillus aquiflavi]
MNKKHKNVRETALELLESVEKNQSYSNLLLNAAIKKNQFNSRDAALLTEITYGTLQRRMTLDFFLKPFLKREKINNWVLHLLRITLYQMIYLNKIPERAAIYEAVEIAKKRGHKGIASFVNGVLRSIQREGVPTLKSIEDPIERLSIETSHPRWIVERWVEQYGFLKTKEMCEINLTAPLQTARVNITKVSRQKCIQLLEEEGYQIEKSPIIPEAIKCLKGNLAHSEVFYKGLITIQDESSMLVSYALNIEQDEMILDACAAPGGKSTHIAEKLNATGMVISLDLHEHKVKLISDNAKRLGLTNIETKVLDSRKAADYFPKESFDRILLDAPCSGLGVLRRKPDIKYTKKEQDLTRLQKVQLELMDALAPLLKPGGLFVYSTCTVAKEENDQVVDIFLKGHSHFEFDPQFKMRMPSAVRPFIHGGKLQVFPQDFGSDGFFIACIKKRVS